MDSSVVLVFIKLIEKIVLAFNFFVIMATKLILCAFWLRDW